MARPSPPEGAVFLGEVNTQVVSRKYGAHNSGRVTGWLYSTKKAGPIIKMLFIY